MLKVFTHRSRLSRLGLLLVLFGLISACASLPILTNVDWQSHQDEINAEDEWTLQGRLNIRSANSSNTISINWTQSTDDFLINLSGALGLGAVKIEGNSQSVRIDKSGESPIFVNSLEEVSKLYLGFEFPASQLQYWIRGIPAPTSDINSAIDMQLNENQLLQSLQQGEWQLEYDRYQEQSSGLILPGRIKVEHTDYRLTFIISRW